MSSARPFTAAADQRHVALDAMTSPAPSSRPNAAVAARRALAAPPSWLPSTPAIDLAIAGLRVIKDELAAGIIIEMASTIADLREELDAVRAVQSVALALLHEQQALVGHLRRQNREFRTTRRAA
jgi:hypothetical protein